MHKIDARPHQTVHVIGEGIFIVEVQEPEDMSTLCEWGEFDIDGKKAHIQAHPRRKAHQIAQL